MPTTTLLIHDEVNCTFQGLPPEIRRHLYNQSKIFNPALRFVPAVRLGRWDGKTAYFAMGGNTYVNLIESTVEYLYNQNYDVVLDDQRTYKRDFEFDFVDKNCLSNVVWPKGHQMEGQPIILRDHQVDAANAFFVNQQGIACLPTASGKSLLTALLSKTIEKYGRSIVIVPNKDLISQTETYYKILGLDVGVYYGDRKDFFKTHTICTWQSLEKLRQSPIDIGEGDPVTIQEFIEDVVAVVVDECLAPGTKILTTDGEINIENIKSGDKVYSFNEETKQFIIDEVMTTHINLSSGSQEKMFELELENGNILQITGNHKVLTDRGWIEVKNLSLSDNIQEFS